MPTPMRAARAIIASPGGVQANTRLQSEGQAVGGSHIFDGGYIGTAIQHITSLYHIPGNADSLAKTRIDLEQTKWTSKGEWRAPTGPLRPFASPSAQATTSMTKSASAPPLGSCGAAGSLIQVVYGQRDAIFRGAEFAAQLDVTPLGNGIFGIDGQYDIVRATFTGGTNVPRIAPMRLGGRVWWRNAEWYARVGLLHAFAQNDIALNEHRPMAIICSMPR